MPPLTAANHLAHPMLFQSPYPSITLAIEYAKAKAAKPQSFALDELLTSSKKIWG